MKHKLLSVVALFGAMFVSTSAFAQWAEPTVPELNEVNATAVESGHTYYIKNVGAGQFMTGGNRWATQISLTRSGWNSAYCAALPIQVIDSTAVIAQSQVTGVALFSKPPFVTRGDASNNGGDANRTVNAGFFFRDSEDAGFVDHGTQDKGYIWKITKADNGYYRIQTAQGDPAYPNAADEYVGWDATSGEIEMDEETLELISGTTAVSMNLTEGVEEYCIDWMFIPIDEFQAQKEAYDVRLQLYEKYVEVMEEADALGLTVNTADAEAIYNNAAATVEDLKAAIADLTYQLNQAKFLADFEGATMDDPVEVTNTCLENPNFDQMNINGWTNTFSGKATNIGLDPNGTVYTNDGTTLTENGSSVDDDGNRAYLNHFIEAWRSNGSPYVIGDAELSQTVYGLPSGMYKLTCDANAVYQWSDPAGSNPVKGVKLFIATDAGTEVSQEVATKDGNPEHFSITFICPDGVKALTFGLKTENTTANWIAADNFRIYYYGKAEISPAHLDLNTVVKQAEDAEITEDENANLEILSNYTKVFENAQAISEKSNPTDEECIEATNALKAALSEAQQSIKDYVNLNNIIEEAKSLAQKAYDAGFEDAGDALEDLWQDWEEQYEARTATKELVDSIDGLATKTLKEKVIGQKIQPGTDLTILLENPGFTKGTTANPIGWTINSGSMGELRASTHNIETWHKAFDISQTLPDMPAGVYDITVQGFVRHDDGGPTDLTWLYGGMTKTELIDLDNDITQKVTEENRNYYEGKEQLGDGNYDNVRGITEDEEGNTLYQCNGMTGAYYWFQEMNPKTGELFYTNHRKVLHEKDGDLTIGIHCESTTDWVIFDNFAITYVGQDASLIRQQLEGILEEYAEVNTANDAFLTAKAAEMAEKIPEEAQKVMDDDNADEMLAKIKEVAEAIEYVKAGNKLAEQLFATVNNYTDRVNNDLEDLIPTDDSYVEILDYWQDGGDFDPTTLADNDAISALIEQIKNGWVAYVMTAATDATTEDPVNVTPVLYNPTYENMNDEGWTSEGGPGWDNYAEIEFYDKNFNHYQTIKGLTPGWYKVTVSGFYRAGFPGDARNALVGDSLQYNAVMYAIAKDSVGTQLVDIFAGAQEYELTYDGTEVTADLPNEDGELITLYIPNRMSSAFDYLGTELYENELVLEVGEDGEMTVGIRKDEHISGDWTIFTNWNVWYFGAQPPVGVKGIQADQPSKNEGVKAIYNLAGQKVSKVQKGIYIINGQKVAIK